MQATTYEDFLKINHLPDTEENKAFYLDGIRRVKLFLAVEAIKAIAGDDEDEIV